MKIVRKHFVVHPTRATIPALAACAANRQNKFMEMEKRIFAAYGQFDEAKMNEHATALGLDMDQFKRDMNGVCKQTINQDRAHLAQVGAGGTPAFFINGRFLGGNQPFPNFKRLIDEELKKAEARIAQGTKVEDYYNEFVLKKGLKRLQ